MQMIPSINTLKKGVLLYRGLRYRKGFGVHSPFVFNLITKVIEEKASYYCLDDIELIRKQMLYREEMITCPKYWRKGKAYSQTVGQIVKKLAIKSKHGALLFRLTNYFHPKEILQIGASMGLSTLYLSSYASGLRCRVLENEREFAKISRIVYEKGARNPIDLRVGNYQESLSKVLEETDKFDFVFFNRPYEQQNNYLLFEMCLSKVHNETVFVFEGIKENGQIRKFWQTVCRCPEVTVTIDLYSMGIVFFNKKLHKRDYIVYY